MIKDIVIGSLNTDLIIPGMDHLLGPGELASGTGLEVGAGGKSRNIAAMLATLRGDGSEIYFIGKTVKDKFGFWEYPVKSLEELKVNTDGIIYSKSQGQVPGLAFIPIDKSGQNQIYLVPGTNAEFGIDDIEASKDVFAEAENFVMTFEMNFEAALRGIELAKEHDLKVMIDPGGIEKGSKFMQILEMGGYLCKPNQHEAEIITGVSIDGFDSAKAAATKLMQMGFENVVITHGEHGSYVFNNETSEHIEIPEIEIDETGSSVGAGDQTMAGLIYGLSQGWDLIDAAKLAVLAGTLQVGKSGIEPITLDEINRHLN